MYYSIKDLRGTLKRSFAWAIILSILVTGGFTIKTLMQRTDAPNYTSSGILYLNNREQSEVNKVFNYGVDKNFYETARLVVTSEPVLAAVSQIKGMNIEDIAISSPRYIDDYYKTPVEVPLIVVEVKGKTPEQAYEAAKVAVAKTKDILSEEFAYKKVSMYKMPVKETLKLDNQSYISKLSVKKLGLIFALAFASVVFLFGIREIVSGKFYSADALKLSTGLSVVSDLSSNKNRKMELKILKYRLNESSKKEKKIYLLETDARKDTDRLAQDLGLEGINTIGGILQKPELINQIPMESEIYLLAKVGKTSRVDIQRVIEVLGLKDLYLAGVIFQ